MDVKFNIEEVRKTMANIKEQSKYIQRYLDECNDIMKENVGSAGGWNGNSADSFKAKWVKAESGFYNFINMIDNYAKELDINIADQSKLDSKDFV